MTEDDAEKFLIAIRWQGGPVACPFCSSTGKHYRIPIRRRFKCRSCLRQFSVTTGTVFSSHKLSLDQCADCLCTCFESNGEISTTALAERLLVSYKTAGLLKMKMFEASLAAAGPLSEPSYLTRGYYQGYNLFLLDQATGHVMRQNRRGETKLAFTMDGR